MQNRGQLLRPFIVIIALVAVPSKSSTIVNKCCPDNDLLTVGFGLCKAADSPPSRQLPPVYSVGNDNLTVSQNNFNLRQNLTVCPDGYVIKSSLDFKLYADGTIKAPGSGRIDAGTFCIHQTHNADEFAAVYCVRNPCQDGVACVRKCCPTGMSVNQVDNGCQLSVDIPFHVSFHDEGGSLLPNPPAFIVRDAAVPDCQVGLMLHDPTQGDVFYILPDGRMYVPHFHKPEDRHIDEYCIDNFIGNNGTSVSYYVKIALENCLSSISKRVKQDPGV